jgi:ribosome-binding ATPase YchF (GTP1/OBG family)
VKGAHEGEGLGNAFLSHIRATDAIFHVVRVFEEKDTGVTHTEGHCDPIRDLEIIRQELRFKDIESVEKAIPDAAKDVRAARACARLRESAQHRAHALAAASVRTAHAACTRKPTTPVGAATRTVYQHWARPNSERVASPLARYPAGLGRGRSVALNGWISPRADVWASRLP